MEKNLLKNIINAPLEIVDILSQEKAVLNLIYNDNSDVLKYLDREVDLELLFKHEYIQLFSPLATEINNYKTGITLSIVLDEIEFYENYVGMIRIYVSSDNSLIKLDGNKNRLLELVNKLVSVLDGAKLSSAGALKILNVNYVIVNENRSGYRINCAVSDYQIVKAEI